MHYLQSLYAVFIACDGLMTLHELCDSLQKDDIVVVKAEDDIKTEPEESQGQLKVKKKKLSQSAAALKLVGVFAPMGVKARCHMYILIFISLPPPCLPPFLSVPY